MSSHLDNFNDLVSAHFNTKMGAPKAYYEVPDRRGTNDSNINPLPRLRRHVYVVNRFGKTIGAWDPSMGGEDYGNNRWIKEEEDGEAETLRALWDQLAKAKAECGPWVKKPTLVWRAVPRVNSETVTIYADDGMRIPQHEIEDRNCPIPYGYGLDFASATYRKILRYERRVYAYMRYVVEECPPALMAALDLGQGVPAPLLPLFLDPGHTHSMIDPGQCHNPVGLQADGTYRFCEDKLQPLMREKDHYYEVYDPVNATWHPCDDRGLQIIGIPAVPKMGDIRIRDGAVWDGKAWMKLPPGFALDTAAMRQILDSEVLASKKSTQPLGTDAAKTKISAGHGVKYDPLAPVGSIYNPTLPVPVVTVQINEHKAVKPAFKGICSWI